MENIWKVLKRIGIVDCLFKNNNFSKRSQFNLGRYRDVNFTLVTNGTCIAHVDKKMIELQKNDLLIIFNSSDYILSKDNPDDKSNSGEFINCSFRITDIDIQIIESFFSPVLKYKLSKKKFEIFHSTLKLAGMEVQEPGSESVTFLRVIFDMLLLHSLRIYKEAPKEIQNGFILALSDCPLAKSLRAMHNNLSHPWTVKSLADRAGMSRSVFAEKFKVAVGKTPLEYLTYCRIHKSCRLMKKRDYSISEIASDVGYESESAFNRAFKKSMGITPGKFRNLQFQTNVYEPRLETRSY